MKNEYVLFSHLKKKISPFSSQVTNFELKQTEGVKRRKKLAKHGKVKLHFPDVDGARETCVFVLRIRDDTQRNDVL